MSWLSQLTGVHISPKGASLSTPDPIGAVKNAVSNPLFDAGLMLALPGVGSGITSLLGKVPLVGGALSSGAQSVEKLLGGGGDSSIPETMPGMSYDPATGQVTTEGGGGIASSVEKLLSGAGSLLTGNGGKNALGLFTGINSALNQSKANNYATDALKGVQDSYNARAPLRAQGISQILNPTPPSLAGLDQTRTVGNPYAAPVASLGTGTPLPVSVTGTLANAEGGAPNGRIIGLSGDAPLQTGPLQANIQGVPGSGVPGSGPRLVKRTPVPVATTSLPTAA